MMKHATKSKTPLDVDRREQNRQAQQAFRQRRKIAEAAQLKKIKQLEDTVEEMSRMLVGLCDEMVAATAAGDLVARPGLMDLLRSSIARSLELAGTVSPSEDEGVAMSEPEKDKSQSPGQETSSSPEQEQSQSPEQHKFQSPEQHKFQSPEQVTILPSQIPPAWPPTTNTATFAMRLVETTLAYGVMYLNGDAYISSSEFQRAFGPSLRDLTTAQLLAKLQYQLGPGRGTLHQNAGLFRPTSDGLVTAFDVQQQLSGLGARDLGPDMMELRIGGGQDGGGAAPGMVVRLKTSLLTMNLANSAVCMEQGPAYPAHEVQKAVEASVVLARGL
ncbi:hypothetical protein F5X68DRAFT_196891 [Plectosphaerella plurivora]|uniref:BZIP domain-containing protein n=1 Tax=Plectosphaerella plurivora TaxID=936078 RepID=A0A9P8VL17_9PEZI|nr:hypothetical protein F5X68DRAFT_196891 [Plectosphaerella plurivora]